ncbi:MAG: hypothetical protein V4613_00295 [Bacteroidota bacterium]
MNKTIYYAILVILVLSVPVYIWLVLGQYIDLKVSVDEQWYRTAESDEIFATLTERERDIKTNIQLLIGGLSINFVGIVLLLLRKNAFVK